MATQKGRNWSSGDIVTAANLQSIERGVSAVAEEYTPTTWANGNTVTAAALNKIEQGIVNAGGSSDFSTAQVTVVNNTSDPISGIYVCVNDGAPFSAVVPRNIFSTGSEDCNVPLYKGLCYWAITDNSLTVSVSGDVEWDSEYGALLITGDGTIAISGGQAF